MRASAAGAGGDHRLRAARRIRGPASRDCGIGVPAGLCARRRPFGDVDPPQDARPAPRRHVVSQYSQRDGSVHGRRRVPFAHAADRALCGVVRYDRHKEKGGRLSRLIPRPGRCTRSSCTCWPRTPNPWRPTGFAASSSRSVSPSTVCPGRSRRRMQVVSGSSPPAELEAVEAAEAPRLRAFGYFGP